MTEHGPTPAGNGAKPIVYLHVGEPKTGTTFLQQVMWRNRAELAAQGVVLPGHHPQEHFRASQDLRGIQKLPSDPAGSWEGEWDVLARQAVSAQGTAVISHELFAACDAAQAQRAVRSLQPAEVHVVLTVRDMATLLPAEWQESVKHRNTRAWQDWLGDVIDNESVAEDRRRFWFWCVHDTRAILDVWAQHVPRERIHVITRPPKGSDEGELWRRFAGLIGVDPAVVDTSRARPNASLGIAEIEFLRRLNEALPQEVPGWFYMWNVKEAVAHQALADRPRGKSLTLPEERLGWAKTFADELVDGLRSDGYDIIGELADLLPPPQPVSGAQPADARPEQMLEAAVVANAALVANHYRRLYPASQPQRGGGRQSVAERVEATVAGAPRLKRVVRQLSARHASVRRLRVTAWRLLERSRARSAR